MLPRSTKLLLHPSVVIAELPSLRRMPAPTPLPTLERPGPLMLLAQWWSARREVASSRHRGAQVVLLRA